jgi:hypothetical protein
LNAGDLILDVGSFTNEWNDKINPNGLYKVIKFEAQAGTGAWVYNGTFKLGGTANAMSIFEMENKREFRCVDIADYMNEPVAVCKINIEGSEYTLLKHMIQSGKIMNIKNIQVQFHIVDGIDHEQEYNDIKNLLEITHELTWRYPFCWENWQRKEIC